MRIIENTTHIPTEELRALLIEWAKKSRVSTAKLRVRCIPYQGRHSNVGRGTYYPFGEGIVMRLGKDIPIESIIHIWVHELQHHKYSWMPFSRRRKIRNKERWCEENTVKILVKNGIPVRWTGYKVRKKFAENIREKYGVELPLSCTRSG